MFNQRPVVEHKLWVANSITKNTNESTTAVDLRQIAQDGTFSIKYTVTGDGTCKFEYTVCDTIDGTYLEPSGASDIASSITSSSGTSGTDWVSFSPILAPFMKIKCTETGTSNAVVVTLSLFTQ
jgi:hypothetical protein